jgi:hypothetical protein
MILREILRQPHQPVATIRLFTHHELINISEPAIVPLYRNGSRTAGLVATAREIWFDVNTLLLDNYGTQESYLHHLGTIVQQSDTYVDTVPARPDHNFRPVISDAGLNPAVRPPNPAVRRAEIHLSVRWDVDRINRVELSILMSTLAALPGTLLPRLDSLTIVLDFNLEDRVGQRGQYLCSRNPLAPELLTLLFLDRFADVLANMNLVTLVVKWRMCRHWEAPVRWLDVNFMRAIGARRAHRDLAGRWFVLVFKEPRR